MGRATAGPAFDLFVLSTDMAEKVYITDVRAGNRTFVKRMVPANLW